MLDEHIYCHHYILYCIDLDIYSRKMNSFNVSKHARPRLDATFNGLSHGSALLVNFAFAVRQPDSHMSLAWNWRETNMHL